MRKLDTSLNTRCRLLCPECNDLKRVKKVLTDTESPTIAVLECGHLRGELLALAPGRISIEDMGTKRGRECFPATLGKTI
jgi:hypothetical protein